MDLFATPGKRTAVVATHNGTTSSLYFKTNVAREALCGADLDRGPQSTIAVDPSVEITTVGKTYGGSYLQGELHTLVVTAAAVTSNWIKQTLLL